MIRQPGPWTSHGHDIPGITVAGPGGPPRSRCLGPRGCEKCSLEAEQAFKKATTPPRWRIEGTWLALEVNVCTCDPHYGAHQPHCGLEPEVDLSTLPGWDAFEQRAVVRANERLLRAAAMRANSRATMAGPYVESVTLAELAAIIAADADGTT